MELTNLLKNISYNGNPKNIMIDNITYNSKKIKKNSLFIAIKGKNYDGNDYIEEAINKGAKAILTSKKISHNIPTIYVKNIRVAMSSISANYYNNPSEKMKIIGITGTNGKTSISQILSNMLTKSKIENTSIGTLGFITPTGIINTGFTTPESIELQKLLNLSKSNGIKYNIMEVSSHSIEMDRIRDIKFDIAIFSNLSSEHLDFHKNMNNYFQSKLKLFKKLRSNNTAIINIDDNYGKNIIKTIKSKIITYGFNNRATIYPTKIKYSIDGIKASIMIKGISINIHSHLIGSYNILNIMASIGSAIVLNIPVEHIINGIHNLESIPGRMEKINSPYIGNYFIDYAHTPDAFLNIFSGLKTIVNKNHKIITVFGCGGNRDAIKRPMMGKIASEYSTHIIITSDNPRNENVEKIISEIIKGITLTNYSIVSDREEAIKKAISISTKNTIILVLGKGRENYQIINKIKIYHNDVDIIKNYKR